MQDNTDYQYRTQFLAIRLYQWIVAIEIDQAMARFKASKLKTIKIVRKSWEGIQSNTNILEEHNNKTLMTWAFVHKHANTLLLTVGWLQISLRITHKILAVHVLKPDSDAKLSNTAIYSTQYLNMFTLHWNFLKCIMYSTAIINYICI